MSISLDRSPFRDSVPCSKAREVLGKIWCDDKFCRSNLCVGKDSCNFYTSITSDFVNQSSEDIDDEIVELAVYQHYKGNQYRVICIAEHSETGDQLVVYRALYPPYKTYARPIQMFKEQIEDINYRYRGPRFRKVS